MKARRIALKLMEAGAVRPSLATAEGPVFQMLDPPGVEDAHGDTMDAGALLLPPGVTEIPLYWLHSYHDALLPGLAPDDRLPVGMATVWQEGWQWYFTPRFSGLTDLSTEASAALAAGQVEACSVGYRTVLSTPNGKGPSGAGEDVHKARLMEVSLIPPGEKGAKAGAVRVKNMNDETKPQEQDLKAEVKALSAALTAMAAKVDAIHGKLLPPEDKPKEEPPAEEKPPAEVATKAWDAFRAPRAA